VRLSGHSFTRPRDRRINPLEKLSISRLRQSAEIPFVTAEIEECGNDAANSGDFGTWNGVGRLHADGRGTRF
jgi:hypothetical protein